MLAVPQLASYTYFGYCSVSAYVDLSYSFNMMFQYIYISGPTLRDIQVNQTFLLINNAITNILGYITLCTINFVTIKLVISIYEHTSS